MGVRALNNRLHNSDMNLPTVWQTVILRLSSLVEPKRLAEALSTDEATIVNEAKRLGMPLTGSKNIRERAYITVIREMWHILPKAQLLTLLDMSEARFDFILKEEDFLLVKLGYRKPECDMVSYSPLTYEELAKTEEASKIIKEYYRPQPLFDFSLEDEGEAQSEGKDNNIPRIIHGYLTPCGDPFATNSREYLPDSLLLKYKREGINGIWLHGVLSSLSYYPFDESLSAGFEARRHELNSLIKRCARFGIGVYLYLNEPRFIPLDKGNRFSHLLGHKSDTGYSLCLAKYEVKSYLKEAIRSLLSECPLRGIITITMSEYQTHCRWRTDTNCPYCKDKSAEELCALVNNTILEGIIASGADTELIANIWGWSDFLSWDMDMTKRGISMLDKRISVMAVSEYSLPIEKGGVKNKIVDYSISNVGPSEVTREALGYAKVLGHKIYAKIQANNSWESENVPYLPVFPLVSLHIKALREMSLDGYMLSWTNGGYPSPTLNMISAINEGKTLHGWYASYYEGDAEIVERGVNLISSGFTEYPFSCDHLYFSPETLGEANLWSLEYDERASGMVCYAFDDYERWLEKYPLDIFLQQTEKMLTLWGEGVDILRTSLGKRARELALFAEVAYLHLECDLLHTRYASLKRNTTENRDELLSIFDRAERSAKRLIELSSLDGRIAFEASNHYFYTIPRLVERILNLEKLKKELSL